MTLTKKMFEALFLDNSGKIEHHKGIGCRNGIFLFSYGFKRGNTLIYFDTYLSEKNIIDLAKQEFGKDETGLVFDDEGYLDMSQNEIIEYLDDNAKRLALHVRMWYIENVID